jgi:hypothetical protein
MSEQIVSSFNIFLDSDRGSPNSSSKGDDFELNLTGINIDCEKGQLIRLTVNNFSMYKSFPNVNQNNSKFKLKTNKGDTIIDLEHQNYKSIYDIATNFAEKVAEALLTLQEDTTGTNANTNNIDSTTPTVISPAQDATPIGTSSNIIQFRVDFKAGGNLANHDFTTDNVQIQFIEKYNSGDDSDIYSLLGGDRIATEATAGNINSIDVTSTTNTNFITFTCKFPAQRHTEQFVYLRSSLTSNTLATSSLEAGNTTSPVNNVHHSNIVGRFPIDTEVIAYDAGTGREYFIDLPSQKHINNIRFYLTDHHGRRLPGYTNQNTLGNLNFNMVLRCDIIQKRAPNERFTPDIVRTAPSRYSNTFMQYDGHTRT